ncbi:hypothetical protein [Hymenobacter negativus]|uniref:Uncharacterized protein n=1 Tax=Hymenobacter negativus TaxID=2795026 RepID=A0ABS0Q1D4_9BACT|nr:hypothetical protein [Hymenobacter negativus]MBH8556440.1 hypothetical protein [Hymenobacter negativus]
MTKADILFDELRSLKTQHHNTLKQLELKLQEIAIEISPLKIGDKVKVVRGEKTIEGEVTVITYFYSNIADGLFNSIDSKPTWCVQGQRINSTTGIPGKWGFDANPVYYDYEQTTRTFTLKDDILSALLGND